jgi:hypothetical protein
MNIFLWILQIILTIKLLTVTLTHGLQQSKPTIQEARLKLGPVSLLLLYVAALGSLLGALGLILPGVLDMASWITPLTALLVAAMLAISVFLHVLSREKPKIFVSLVLFLIAAFIAYGRWALVT